MYVLSTWQSALVTYKLSTYKITFHYILILLERNMKEYVHKCHYNETAKIYLNLMAVYITAICTAQLKMSNDKNKTNQTTGSYKYVGRTESHEQQFFVK